jgi:hypothetical protein
MTGGRERKRTEIVTVAGHVDIAGLVEKELGIGVTPSVPLQLLLLARLVVHELNGLKNWRRKNRVETNWTTSKPRNIK